MAADNPIAILRAEHESILRACNATDALARLLLQHEAVSAETMFERVQFFLRFVDGQHRLRDEDLLFPLLERIHVAADAVSKSRLDYEDGRWWIRSLAQLAEAYHGGCVTAGRRWAETAQAYAEMLRAQIEAEDRLLLPLAEHELSTREQSEPS